MTWQTGLPALWSSAFLRKGKRQTRLLRPDVSFASIDALSSACGGCKVRCQAVFDGGLLPHWHRGGGALASSENRRGGAKLRQPYREHRRMRTSAELPCVLINSHQITPPTPFPTIGGSFCPPPPSGPPSPQTPAGCGRPGRVPAKKPSCQGRFCVVPLTSSFSLRVMFGGHWGGSCRNYVKLGAFPSCPTYTITLFPTPALFASFFPAFPHSPTTD